MKLLRESALGLVVCLVIGNKILAYEEECLGFQLPEAYQTTKARTSPATSLANARKTFEKILHDRLRHPPPRREQYWLTGMKKTILPIRRIGHSIKSASSLSRFAYTPSPSTSAARYTPLVRMPSHRYLDCLIQLHHLV